MGYNWQQGLEGAGGGALSGGSIGGPWGAAIGAGVGLLSGFGGGESSNEKKSRQMLMDYYNQVQNRQNIPGVNTAQGSYSDIRNRQLGLADHLTALSQGKGPSLAEAQLRSATDRNAAQQAGMANSGRGGPMASMQAANNIYRGGAQAAQDSVAGRISEEQMALQQLGLTLHGARGQDEEMNRFNAGQSNEVGIQNMYAQLKQRGMNDDAIMGIIGRLQGQNSAVAGRPGLGDQVLAGGAGMYSQYLAQKSQKKVG